ncbi:hypothetical protein [Chryseosolibacter indicus]|uniref:PE-PGRS family protein n=1 Tax=Chryseosolibacter indicus TaxID=2782351 RepID=A0ABS5VQA8_9BACT|nr:hypothetical protein [Chryseosolibacter indicus]MBT1703635.1 hypothetical protein [Chryseosolibacter indicus]
MIRTAILISLLFTYGCSNAPDQQTSNIFAPGEKLAEVKGKKLDELSGLAASVSNPGYLWTHNDSGNKPEVFLVDTKLNVKLTCTLEGIKNRDWEDITVGPGPDPSKSYVYVGDIGDNMARYEYKYVYRFEEPKVTEGSEEMVIKDFERITFSLEGKKKDTESLLINPQTKDLYVVSKREEPVVVYKVPYPYDTNDSLVASPVASISVTQVVAGDFSADGKEILLKNYQNVYYWKIEGGKTVDQTLNTAPKVLPYEEEPQGEAITFARDGSGFYTVSEKVSGEKSYLIFYKRK